jgi:hypothetical protein
MTFADNRQEGMKHEMTGATQAQLGTTLWITLMCNCYFPDFILFYLAFIFFKSISVLLSPILRLDNLTRFGY